MSHDPVRRGVLLLGVGSGLALLLLEMVELRWELAGTAGLLGLVPIAVSFVLGGRLGAAVAALVAVGGIVAVVGGPAGVMVTLRHVLPGFALGVALARRACLAVSLMAVGAASLAGLVLLVWAYMPGGPTLLDFLRRRLESHLAELELLPDRFGLAQDPGLAAEAARLMVTTMEVAGPAVLLVGVLFSALTNYLGARLVLRGGGFRPFATEAVPDHLVWGVVVGGILLASREHTAGMIGLNLLIVLGVFYAIQGLAVLRHLFQKARVPRPLQGVSFGLFALQPLLLVAAACLGLFDLWMDFRKIRQVPTPA